MRVANQTRFLPSIHTPRGSNEIHSQRRLDSYSDILVYQTICAVAVTYESP